MKGYAYRMAPALPLLSRPGDYIDGRFQTAPRPDGELLVRGPADVRELVSAHDYAVGQVDAAVAAARAAFPGFRKLGTEARAELLRRYQARLRAHREEIALAIALEVGKPLWEAVTEVDAMAGKVDLSLGEGARFTAGAALANLPGEIRYRPLGVVAVVGPFNFPGHLPNGQIVPALLLGNCVVHKPSEKTPSAAVWIARCMDEAGFPKGAFNLVQGPGESGARLTTHADVDAVLFTGSVSVGRRIARDNADRIERLIALELGGKNAAIVLSDCDLERTARAIAFAAFATAGQRCSSTSRVIASEEIAPRLLERLAEIAGGLRVGYPLEADVFMGPVISEAARNQLVDAQTRARAAGFEPVVAGGAVELAGREGFYVRPAIHRAPAGAPAVPGYSDDELFGPDLAFYTAPDLEAALALANRSRFGLTASVFTGSRAAFERAAEELDVGVLNWNRASAGASGRLPFGGVKQSGNHRPAGILAGAACAYAQGVMLSPEPDPGPLPVWPGMAL